MSNSGVPVPLDVAVSEQVASALSSSLAALNDAFHEKLRDQEQRFLRLLESGAVHPASVPRSDPSRLGFNNHPMFPNARDLREAGPSSGSRSFPSHFPDYSPISDAEDSSPDSSDSEEDVSPPTESSPPSLGDILGDKRYAEVFPLMELSQKAVSILGGEFPEFRFAPFRATVSELGLSCDNWVFNASQVFLALWRGVKIVLFLELSPQIQGVSKKWKTVDFSAPLIDEEVDYGPVIRSTFSLQMLQASAWKIAQKGSSTSLAVPPKIFESDVKWLNPKTKSQATVPKIDLPLTSSEDSGSLLAFLQGPKLDKDSHLFADIAQTFTVGPSEELRNADLAARQKALVAVQHKALLSLVKDMLSLALLSSEQTSWVSLVTSARDLLGLSIKDSRSTVSDCLAEAASKRKACREEALKGLAKKDADVKMKLLNAPLDPTPFWEGLGE